MTKIQHKRRTAYLKKLKACGFRSWKRANKRRGELIDLKVSDKATEHESDELARLQALLELYLTYKTNDQLGRNKRFLDRKLKKIGITL